MDDPAFFLGKFSKIESADEMPQKQHRLECRFHGGRQLQMTSRKQLDVIT